eukprot:scaffold46579_cov66-Attheya_sp.AAC.3
MSQCWLEVYLPLVGLPALALLYAIAVQIFLAAWTECSWTHHMKPLAIRVSLLIVALACALPLCEQRKANQSSDSIAVFVVVTLGCIATSLGSYAIYGTYQQEVQGPKPVVPPGYMSGKVVLVTGANAGIGRETARQLVAEGATVILACRSEARAKEAMQDIIESIMTSSSDPNSKGEGTHLKLKDVQDQLKFLELSLSSLASVRKAVATFTSWNMPLHVLVNNAGVVMGSRQVTDDGHELTMQVNHFSHFLLTQLLLEKLQQSSTSDAPSRIITVTSSTYTLATQGIYFDDFGCETRSFSMFGQYSQSKLASILCAKELSRRQAKTSQKGTIESYIVHPGLVRTDVTRNMPWFMRLGNEAFAWVLVSLQKTPKAGAYTSVFCAASPDALQYESGTYFVNSQPTTTNDFARDTEVETDTTRYYEIDYARVWATLISRQDIEIR